MGFPPKSNYVKRWKSYEVKGLFGRKKQAHYTGHDISDAVGIYALTLTEFCSIYRGDGTESCVPPLAIDNWNKREIISIT